jgi:hypothetical protein
MWSIINFNVRHITDCTCYEKYMYCRTEVKNLMQMSYIQYGIWPNSCVFSRNVILYIYISNICIGTAGREQGAMGAGARSKSAGAGSKGAGAVSKGREQGARGRKQGSRGREQGTRGRKQGSRWVGAGREHGARGREQGARGREQGAETPCHPSHHCRLSKHRAKQASVTFSMFQCSDFKFSGITGSYRNIRASNNDQIKPFQQLVFQTFVLSLFYVDVFLTCVDNSNLISLMTVPIRATHVTGTTRLPLDKLRPQESPYI